MKDIKFKAKRYKVSSIYAFTIVATIFLTFSITNIIIKNINDNVLIIAKNTIETENDLIFKRAYTKKNSANVNPDELINIIKNKNDEIVSVDFKVFECEKMLMLIIEEMNKDTIRFTKNGYALWIPMGYMSHSPLLVNLGPKIPVKIATSDIVLGDVKTKITEFGVNNAMVEIYINIKIKLITSLPVNSRKDELNYTALIASKIITGKVPSFYNGSISKTSESFNLPIEENM